MKKILSLFLIGLLLGLSPLLTPALAQPSGGDLYYTLLRPAHSTGAAARMEL